MADVIVRKTEKLMGEIEAPASKSYTHRMLVAALLSNGMSRITKPLISEDTLATLHAIESLGAQVEKYHDVWRVKGRFPLKTSERPIDCRESGATLRFMVPIAALAPGNTTFVMKPSLGRRPITPLLQSLGQLGVKTFYKADGAPTITVQGGGIRGGKATLHGDISSQFISGLLFACPLVEGDTEIHVIPPVESKSYIEMTIEILSKHAIRVSRSEDFSYIYVPGKQAYKPFDHIVPGDFSSAAYILAAAAITRSRVRIRNLDPTTMQGDKAILEILNQAGLKVTLSDGLVEVEGGISQAIEVDASNIPDLVPACAAIACYASGVSRIYNAKRLRYKESDRLTSLHMELKKMGADIVVEEDNLIIKGPCNMHGANIDPHNDHRIAMACAAAALGAKGETRIIDAECVRKSYPTFFRDLSLLGANIIGGKLDW